MIDTTVMELESMLMASSSELSKDDGDEKLWRKLVQSAIELGMIPNPVGFGEDEVPVDFNLVPGDVEAEWKFILTYVALAVIRDQSFQRLYSELPEILTCCMYQPDDPNNWLWHGAETVVIDLASWKDREGFTSALRRICDVEIVTGDYSVRNVRIAFHPQNTEKLDTIVDTVRFNEYTKKYGNPSISTVPPQRSPDHRSADQRRAEDIVMQSYTWFMSIKEYDYGYDILNKTSQDFGKDISKEDGKLVVRGVGSPLDYLPVDDSTNVLTIIALVATTLGIEVPLRVKYQLRLPYIVPPWA